jgi:hypothetical protein
MYMLLVYAHIVSAIASIGPLFVLLVLLYKMKKADDHILGGYVQAFQGCIDVVRYAGHAVVATGLLLVITGGWSWGATWIIATLTILAISLVFLARAFKPTMKTFGTDKFNKSAFIAKLTKNTWIYVVLLLVILGLMVNKPYL